MKIRTLRRLTPGKRFLLVAAAGAALALPIAVGVIHAQSAEAPVRFEVASVKENHSGQAGAYFRPSAGRMSITNMALKRMIMFAWNIQDFQISGAPDWITSAFYDVEAKVGTNTTTEQNLRLMLQSLLEDRFQLTIHRETKTLPAYALTVARTGTRLQESKEGSCAVIDPNHPPEHVPQQDRMRECGSHGWGRDNLMEKHLPLASLATDLSYMLGRTVIDKTGLNGPYDIDLKFAPDEAVVAAVPHSGAERAGDTLPAIFTALQEQLGLKLESTKAPVEILVIDHIDRPSQN